MNNQFILNQILRNPQIQNNPMAKNAIEMYQRGDLKGLNEMANNIAREKGVDLNEITQNIKNQFGL